MAFLQNAEGTTCKITMHQPLVHASEIRFPKLLMQPANMDAAVAAHIAGRSDIAENLIRLADMPLIGEWTESVWGKKSPYVRVTPSRDGKRTPAETHRASLRMPTSAERHGLHSRDGYHCRFCGIPVIRPEVRKRIMNAFPLVLRWGKRNTDQHTAFQAMWAQYDHLTPHSRGGANDLENIVVTCAPCNFGRMEYTLEEVGLIDPRLRQPIRSAWDGLERFPVAVGRRAR
jgi:hypothetical protein